MRTFALLSLLYAALTLAAVRWGEAPGPAHAGIVVVYGLGIMVADLCTALLLAALYRAVRASAILLLACAYLYGGVMAWAHMATFPGALFPEPVAGNEHTVTWLFVAWRLGEAALMLAAIVQAGRAKGAASDGTGRRLFAAVALTAALAALVIALAARFATPLPELVAGLQWTALALFAAAYAWIWRRRAFGDLFYVWVGLVLVASMADLALSSLAPERFTFAWYAARANLLVGACLLFAYLLSDSGAETRAAPKASAVAAYGGAVAVTLAALFLRWFLDPWLDDRAPYATLYGAVAIAVWFGGLGPAVLAMLLGYGLINVRYVAPHGELAIGGPADGIALGLFALSTSLVIVLGEAMRRARDRYRASEAELTARALELQRADENKSRFLAVMAHELRNPLAPLQNGIALLRMRRDEVSVDETHDMMERQIAQLTRLIDDLLDTSRIDRGKLELRMQPVALAEVVRTGVDTARPNIDARGHALEVRAPQDSLCVEGDPVRLAQVVSNLLNNAAKFTPPGGRIELSAGAEHGRAVLRVADNGIGIAPEHLNEVFDMFVQLGEPHAGTPGGLGLGLTLARAIVLRHGGEIEVRSAGRGKGTEFTVRLPVRHVRPTDGAALPSP